MSHNSVSRYALWVSLATSCFLVSPAHAQNDPLRADATAPAGTDDIIVTAQKRAQNVQDVPIAVSAFGKEQLEKAGVVSSADLTQVTPGLNFSRTVNFAQPVIRGVGTASTSPGDEANVATYVDGVYIAQMTAALYDFNNISSVEVLKGPQGTLFGRNATGGAINVTTRDPSVDPAFEGEATYGRFNERTVKAYMTGGSGDLAANIAFVRSKRDGYIQNLGTGEKDAFWDKTLVRGKILYDPGGVLRLTLTADYSDIGDNGGNALAPQNGNTVGRLFAPVPPGPYQIDTNFRPVASNKQYGGSLKAEFKLDGIKVVSITAYRHNRAHAIEDLDSTRAPVFSINNIEKSRTRSQELQILSDNDSRFSWIVGAFYFHNNAGHEPLSYSAFGSPILIQAKQIATSYAGFADGTFQITPQLSLTAGIRYSTEKRRFNGTYQGFPAPGLPSEKTFSDFTPRAVLSYKPTDDSLVYASFSQGFKSGTYNVSALQATPVSPEKLTSYELGYKTKIGGVVTWNTALYYYDYKDLQVQVAGQGATLTQLANAANATMYGVDSEFSARVSDRLSFRVGVAYLHSEYKDFKNAPTLTPTGVGGNVLGSGDVSGNKLVRAPDITVSVGGNYTYPLANGSSIEFASNLFFSGGFFWDVDNRLRQPSYEVLNGNITWHSADERWKIGVWGRNLTSSQYRDQALPTQIGDVGVITAPVQYGVTVGVSF